LRDAAPELLLPGVDKVPADTVALLETTPRLIEAYMVGLNHELSRELLWREYPTDLRGTWFRQFWDVRDQPGDPEALKDIPPLRAGSSCSSSIRASRASASTRKQRPIPRRRPTTSPGRTCP